MTDLVVVVPARDEQTRIGSCLRSVRRSLAHAGQHGLVNRSAVVVVGHRCDDDTLGRAETGLAGIRHAAMVDGRSATVGDVRALGVRAAIDALPMGDRAARRGTVWVLSTDADTTVPLTWVADILGHASSGAAAVVGMARLAGERHGSAGFHAAYAQIIAAGLHGPTHDHVYGANLAVRSDAYAAVGGFRPVAVGEDRALVDALAVNGAVLARPRGLLVTTSDRRHGRASGGLAELLARLDCRPSLAELSTTPRVA